MLWDIYLYLSCLLVHLLILKYLVFLFIKMQGCYSLASITEVNTLSYILLTTSEKKCAKRSLHSVLGHYPEKGPPTGCPQCLLE